MKKYFKILVLVVAITLVVGCGKVAEEKEIVKTCTSSTNDVANGYKLESEYKVYAKGDVVDRVVTTETITSDNQETLDYFEEYLESTYSSIDEVYGGYENEVTNENGKVVSETTIDYNEMDLTKYVEDNTAMKSYVNSDNKILLEGVISIYESLGAVCE